MRKQNKLNPDDISYADETDKDYQKGLDSCMSVKDLRKLAEYYSLLFPDMHKEVMLKMMDEETFNTFRRGLKKERKGVFQGEAFMRMFGIIILPNILMRVGCIATKFCVPFGTAYRRLRDAGLLEKEKK